MWSQNLKNEEAKNPQMGCKKPVKQEEEEEEEEEWWKF